MLLNCKVEEEYDGISPQKRENVSISFMFHLTLFQ